VVRIEAGMVIVDTKDVDQEVGKDLDPEHEKAEVEDCGTMGEPRWGNQDGGTKMGTPPEIRSWELIGINWTVRQLCDYGHVWPIFRQLHRSPQAHG
jgi:hypothetical protein